MKLNLQNAASFVPAGSLNAIAAQTAACNELLENGHGAGNDYIGWVTLPAEINDALLSDIEATAKQLRECCEIVVVAGIGGSYLGARAVNEALASSFDAYMPERKNPIVVYAGNNTGED